MKRIHWFIYNFYEIWLFEVWIVCLICIYFFGLISECNTLYRAVVSLLFVILVIFNDEWIITMGDEGNCIHLLNYIYLCAFTSTLWDSKVFLQVLLELYKRVFSMEFVEINEKVEKSRIKNFLYSVLKSQAQGWNCICAE